MALKYRWYVGTKLVKKAHGAKLLLKEKWVGKRLRVKVVATAAGYPTLKVLTARSARITGSAEAHIGPASCWSAARRGRRRGVLDPRGGGGRHGALPGAGYRGERESHLLGAGGRRARPRSCRAAGDRVGRRAAGLDRRRRGRDGRFAVGPAAAGPEHPSIAAGLSAAGVEAPFVVESDLLAMFCAGSSELDGHALVAGTGAAAIRVRGGEVEAVADGSGLAARRRGLRLLDRPSRRARRGRGPGRSRSVDRADAARAGPARHRRDRRARRSSLSRLTEIVYDMRPVQLARLAPLAFAVGDDAVAGAIVEGAAQALARTLAQRARRPDRRPAGAGWQRPAPPGDGRGGRRDVLPPTQAAPARRQGRRRRRRRGGARPPAPRGRRRRRPCSPGSTRPWRPCGDAERRLARSAAARRDGVGRRDVLGERHRLGGAVGRELDRRGCRGSRRSSSGSAARPGSRCGTTSPAPPSSACAREAAATAERGSPVRPIVTAPRSAASRNGSTTSEVAPEWEIAIATSSAREQGRGRQGLVHLGPGPHLDPDPEQPRLQLVGDARRAADAVHVDAPRRGDRPAGEVEGLVVELVDGLGDGADVGVRDHLDDLLHGVVGADLHADVHRDARTPSSGPSARPGRAAARRGWRARCDWANRVTDACDTPARAASATAESRAASAGSASTVSATSRSAPVSRGATVRIRSVRSLGR